MKCSQLFERLLPSGLYKHGRPFVFRYLCRKALLLRIVAQGKGRFLEIGFGRGDWILTLGDLGFEGVGIDLSDEAVRELQSRVGSSRLGALKGDIMETELSQEFDWVFAFEVIEHIKDDELAFRRVARLLKPGGKFILSVPSHMRYWTKHDEAAGHFRRYERSELIHKLSGNGFKVIIAWNYGFPLGVLLYPLKSLIAPSLVHLSMEERSSISSRPRPVDEKLNPLIVAASTLLLPIQLWLQNRFLGSDLGDGYVMMGLRD